MAVRQKRVVIMGAAGRDFHNFNVVLRADPMVRVIAFTATQIPGIEGRCYPPSLAGPLYPEGIPIVSEEMLDGVIRDEHIDEVIFAYSDVSHEFVMHQASRVLAAGADFSLLGPGSTTVPCSVPVIAVLAVRTGAGKSPASRFIADVLLSHGVRPALIRHPMPYGDLAAQRVQRFASLADLDLHQATIEEREEYEPLIRKGLVVWAGVDYAAIVAEAEKEAPLIIWDGGNNDFSFLRTDLEIVIADPFRPGHESAYHPGETNLRRAGVVVINKVNSAPAENVVRVEQNVARLNPGAVVVKTRSLVTVNDPEEIRGKRVLVVEDGPTLTHGGMATGAGVQAAQEHGARHDRSPALRPRRARRRVYDLPSPGAHPARSGLLPRAVARPRGHYQGRSGRRGVERHAFVAGESHPRRQAHRAGVVRDGRDGGASPVGHSGRFPARQGRLTRD